MTRWLRLAAVLALTVAAYFVLPVGSIGSRGLIAQGAGALVLLLLAAWVSFQQVRASVSDDSRRIDGLVLAIVVSVAALALAAYSLESRDPGQFVGLETRLDALYFTVATLMTVGYGDIHPAGQTARALVLGQMCFNVLVVAATASLLATRVREGLRRRVRDQE